MLHGDRTGHMQKAGVTIVCYGKMFNLAMVRPKCHPIRRIGYDAINLPERRKHFQAVAQDQPAVSYGFFTECHIKTQT